MNSWDILCNILLLSSLVQSIPVDIGICDDENVKCTCGSKRTSIDVPVKQCSRIHKWQLKCGFCKDFDLNKFCSKFSQCQECDSKNQVCSTCPANFYGAFCINSCNCENGGTCVSTGECLCPSEYEGRKCEHRKVAHCPLPERIQNGYFMGQGTMEGNSIVYDCNKGYVLSGQKTRICTSKGVWSDKLPSCVPFCEKPEIRPNLIETVVELLDNLLGSLTSSLLGKPIKSISYKCEEGYQLVGAETITCKKNGRWSDQPPFCKKICPTLKAPENGNIMAEKFIEDSAVKFSCKLHFILIGPSTITCLKNGTWSSDPPRCANVSFCQKPELQKNGAFVIHDTNGKIVQDDVILDGYKMTVYCNNDYLLVGKAESVCQQNGLWKGKTAPCIKWPKSVSCKTKGKDVIGNIGEIVRIDCPSHCMGTSNVIGTAIYSENSFVCRAAIHIGKISNAGGAVYIANNGLFSSFESSLLNGIQSLRSNKPANSFRFIELEKEIEDNDKDVICPFGWEQHENLCLYFPLINGNWNFAKKYCEYIQGTLLILEQMDQHFTLTSVMEEKAISKVWIGMTKEEQFVWLDGLPVDEGNFDAWSKGEPEQNKTCVYTALSGWASDFCDHSLPFICQYSKSAGKENVCPNLDPISHGKGSGDEYEDIIYVTGSVISFTCNEYHYLKGSNQIVCLNDGKWSSSVPTCSLVPSCTEPPVPVNSKILHIIPPETRFKRQISRLNHEYHPDKIEDNDQENSTENIYFGEKNVTVSPDIILGNETSLLTDLNSTDEYENFSGDEIITKNETMSEVLSNNSRNEELIKNETIPKVPKERPRRIFRMDFGHMKMENDTEDEKDNISKSILIPHGHHRVNTKVRYSCESNFYEIVGPKTITCLPNGQWTDLPTCQQVCGRTSFPRPPLIVNGNISEVGQWPWQVGVGIQFKNSWQIACGGSLLNKNWIITAAHCVTFSESTQAVPMNRLLIYLGKHYREVAKDDEYVQTREVIQIVVHSGYNPHIYDTDIALVKLNKPVEFNYRIQPICLPPLGNLETTERLQEGQKGFVTGWGKTETNEDAKELRYASVPIVSKRKCEQDYMEADMPFIITENMYCAGFEEGIKDACSGDSGGPMVFHSDKGNWILEGLVSWGSPQGCAFPKQYGGYTRVERFIDWIDLYI